MHQVLCLPRLSPLRAPQMALRRPSSAAGPRGFPQHAGRALGRRGAGAGRRGAQRAHPGSQAGAAFSSSPSLTLLLPAAHLHDRRHLQLRRPQADGPRHQVLGCEVEPSQPNALLFSNPEALTLQPPDTRSPALTLPSPLTPLLFLPRIRRAERDQEGELPTNGHPFVHFSLCAHHR